MRVEKVWIEQCWATKAIRRRFGAKSALDYVIGEKLLMFADAAKDDATFAKELSRFLAAICSCSISTKSPATSRAEDQRREERFDNFSACAEDRSIQISRLSTSPPSSLALATTCVRVGATISRGRHRAAKTFASADDMFLLPAPALPFIAELQLHGEGPELVAAL